VFPRPRLLPRPLRRACCPSARVSATSGICSPTAR
jgi:hypothetical protein